jgi:DNA-binding transcriptional MocR family regulator
LYGVNEYIVCMTTWTPALARDTGSLFLALADAIERDVTGGVLRPGQRLPPHRDLADALGINVSTVTRGYREAERRGLLSATVGRGTFVASDAATSMVAFEPGAPGMLEMGLITPLHFLDPDVSEGFRRIARRKDPRVFMRYSEPRGLPEHRTAGAQWAARYGMEAEAGDIIVCAGAQHALTCILAGLLRSGERIATDALTYPGLKTLAAMLGIRLVPIPMDEEGMTPAGLDIACRRDAIRAVYLMPGVHNPSTASMSHSRRDAIAAVAAAHDLLIIEDDAYDLTHPGEATPVGCRDRERSVYVAGMSKALAAGLRVAFIVAPKRLLKPLAQAVLNTVWMTPPLNVELAAMWIEDGTADAVLAAKRAEAARRYMEACDLLEGLRFRGKPSGFYLWLDLPAPWTGARFEAEAGQAGVSVFGAQRFVVGESAPPPAARISLTGAERMADLTRGLTVIKDLLLPDA